MVVYVRPSNEALLRARVPGAQDQRGCPSIPFIVRVLRAKRAPGRSLLLLLRPWASLRQLCHDLNGFPQNLNHTPEFLNRSAKRRHEDHHVADRA